MLNKKICLYCNKTLVPIGNSRINGKFHDDWQTRKYHKKCYFEIQNEQNRIEYNKNFNIPPDEERYN